MRFFEICTWISPFNLTSDQTVLDAVSGYKIPFIHPPFQLAFPNVPRLSRDHLDCIDKINKLLDKRIISPCTPTEDQFISSFFLVDKPNGSKRFISNFKALNKFIIAPHFNLEDLKTVLRSVSKSCWMATIDIQDAYFAIKIDKNYRKFSRFKFEDTLYEFNCLPFGLCTVPFIFMEIMRPVVHYLRSQFSIGLTERKKLKILNWASVFRKEFSCHIRDAAQFIGTLVSAYPAIKYGFLYTTKIFGSGKIER